MFYYSKKFILFCFSSNGYHHIFYKIKKDNSYTTTAWKKHKNKGIVHAAILTLGSLTSYCESLRFSVTIWITLHLDSANA